MEKKLIGIKSVKHKLKKIFLRKHFKSIVKKLEFKAMRGQSILFEYKKEYEHHIPIFGLRSFRLLSE